MVTHETPEVFLGLDVGKTEHWACAITMNQKVVWNKALPNDEAKLIDMYRSLQEHGSLLVVVDQPATIGALAVALAQAMGIAVRSRSCGCGNHSCFQGLCFMENFSHIP